MGKASGMIGNISCIHYTETRDLTFLKEKGYYHHVKVEESKG